MTKAPTKAAALRQHRQHREPYRPQVPDFGAAQPSEPEVLTPFNAHLFARREMSPNVKAYVRINSTLLDDYVSKSLITRQMCEAGKRYADDHHLLWGSGMSGDSCILPVGGESHETITQSEANTRAKERTNRVLNLAGPVPYVLVRRVCAFEQAIGEKRGRNVPIYRALVVGLLACARVYGVPVYEEA